MNLKLSKVNTQNCLAYLNYMRGDKLGIGCLLNFALAKIKHILKLLHLQGVQEILDLQGIREDARRSSTSPNTLFCL